MENAKTGGAGVTGVASENASAIGPHEKPIKKDSASSRIMERGVVRKTERVGELSPSDGRKKAEKSKGVDAAVLGSCFVSGIQCSRAAERSSL